MSEKLGTCEECGQTYERLYEYEGGWYCALDRASKQVDSSIAALAAYRAVGPVEEVAEFIESHSDLPTLGVKGGHRAYEARKALRKAREGAK